jgi:hypothetical protein
LSALFSLVEKPAETSIVLDSFVIIVLLNCVGLVNNKVINQRLLVF